MRGTCLICSVLRCNAAAMWFCSALVGGGGLRGRGGDGCLAVVQLLSSPEVMLEEVPDWAGRVGDITIVDLQAICRFCG